MEYTTTQIEKAKAAYNSFMITTSVTELDIINCGRLEAERRCEDHNTIVSKINAGDKELEKYWKTWFLRQEVLADQKKAESKAKLDANKAASADVLAPIKSLKKIGEFGKWLNNAKNPFRKQHFTKKYTAEAVNNFLATL